VICVWPYLASEQNYSDLCLAIFNIGTEL